VQVLVNARQLNYHGDRTSDIVGQVVGPTMLGEFLTIYAADYDEAVDMTAAHVRPSTQDEFAAALGNRAPVGLGGRA
jgi:hypothetical protein